MKHHDEYIEESIGKTPNAPVEQDPEQLMMVEQATGNKPTIETTRRHQWLFWILVGLGLVALVVGLSLGLTVGMDDSSDDVECQEPPPLNAKAQACLDESLRFGLVNIFREEALYTNISCVPEDFDPSCEGPDYDKPYWYAETDLCAVSENDDIDDMHEFSQECEIAGGKLFLVDLDEPFFCKGPYWKTEHVMVHSFTVDYSWMCVANGCAGLTDRKKEFQRVAAEYMLQMIHLSNDAIQCSFCPPTSDLTMQHLENCQEKYHVSKFQICEATETKCGFYICLSFDNCRETCAARGGTCLRAGGYSYGCVPDGPETDAASCEEEFGDDYCVCSM